MTKLLLQAFEGNTSKVPFWFMRQAGRYMPEYRALRKEAGSFLNLCLNSDYAAEVTMQPINFYSPSAAIIFADILLVPMAMGQHLDYIEGEGPVLGNLNLSNLEYDENIVAEVFKALEKTRALLPQDKTLIGFAGSPFTVASYMIEGGSPKDFLQVKKMMTTEPEKFKTIIDLLVKATVKYLAKHIQSGAEVIQLFDSWAGALDEDNFDKYVIEPNKAIVEALKADYPHIKFIGFPKGAGVKYKDYLQQVPVDGISLDWTIPHQWIEDNLLPTGKLIQGSFDPALLCSDQATIKQYATKLLNKFGDKKFIFNLGHGIIKHTPPQNAAYLAKVIKEYNINA